ncbi:hypothetical protein, partial [Crocosphaera sp.]|uniref:hypothetical protein n=1 Tax=Crocosphaera sp. TaxID=2729996 RepID=UPI002619E34D
KSSKQGCALHVNILVKIHPHLKFGYSFRIYRWGLLLTSLLNHFSVVKLINLLENSLSKVA